MKNWITMAQTAVELLGEIRDELRKIRKLAEEDHRERVAHNLGEATAAFEVG